jgi:nucleoside-diphosphate-sugar epimerase
MEFKTLLEYFLAAIGEKPHYRKLPFGAVYGMAGAMEWVYRIFRLPGEPALTRYTVCTLGFSQTMDISRARTILGYEPEKTLMESIEEYGKW